MICNIDMHFVSTVLTDSSEKDPNECVSMRDDLKLNRLLICSIFVLVTKMNIKLVINNDSTN